MENIRDGQCGRMSPVPCHQITARISAVSSKRSAKSKTKGFLFLDLTSGSPQEKSWEMFFPSHGECWTRNIGESPREENASILSQILQGVPQRRKRIYLVADFAGGCAGKILFESEGVSGYSPQSFRSWQGAAGSAESSPRTSGIDGYNGDVTGDVSAMPGINCGMSTGRNGVVLNDQGGNRMDITDDVTCTLRAEAHHPPCVLDSAGFCTEHSAKARSIGYEEECSPTLRADTVPAAVALENHPTDSRVKISEDGNVQTLTSRMGTGGNNVPLLMNWDGSQVSPTLTKQNAGGSQRMPDKDNFNCVLQPYGICSKDSNSMKSDNPHSGIYEAETARTLDGNGGNPSCSQGGIAVVESYAIQGSMIGRDNKNGPQGNGINEDVSFTLNTTDRHTVYAMTTGSYMQTTKNQSPTLMARDYKDPAAVQSGYTVRRLTPTECARLQGFPDWWCADLGTENPSYDDIDFWTEVFETHRRSMGTSTKPKTQAQIIKWLKNPYSDSAEYKMWGNGVALPCVHFVLSGIVEFHRNSTDGLNEQIQPEPTESTLCKPQNVVFHS